MTDTNNDTRFRPIAEVDPVTIELVRFRGGIADLGSLLARDTVERSIFESLMKHMNSYDMELLSWIIKQALHNQRSGIASPTMIRLGSDTKQDLKWGMRRLNTSAQVLEEIGIITKHKSYESPYKRFYVMATSIEGLPKPKQTCDQPDPEVKKPVWAAERWQCFNDTNITLRVTEEGLSYHNLSTAGWPELMMEMTRMGATSEQVNIYVAMLYRAFDDLHTKISTREMARTLCKKQPNVARTVKQLVALGIVEPVDKSTSTKGIANSGTRYRFTSYHQTLAQLLKATTLKYLEAK